MIEIRLWLIQECVADAIRIASVTIEAEEASQGSVKLYSLPPAS
jgi:hypothetical protein